MPGCHTHHLAAEGWNGQGRVAANRKQWRSATDQFRKAVVAIPANAEFLNNLAYSGMQMGEIGASVSYLRQAHELDPKSGPYPQQSDHRADHVR